MSAALEVEGWDDTAHPINSDGEQGRAELARGCGDLWAAALGRYFEDARSFLRGVKHGHDEGESLDDLTGERRLLANLCRPLDACPQRVGDAFIEALDAGLRFNSGAMHRPVPEIHDDLRLGEWKERTKSRGKPQAISLR